MGVPVGAVLDEDVYNNKYLELCKGLNLDKNAASRAWDTYLTVKENYSLDVSIFVVLNIVLQRFVVYIDCVIFFPILGRPESLVGLCHLCSVS